MREKFNNKIHFNYQSILLKDFNLNIDFEKIKNQNLKFFYFFNLSVLIIGSMIAPIGRPHKTAKRDYYGYLQNNIYLYIYIYINQFINIYRYIPKDFSFFSWHSNSQKDSSF